MNRIKHQQVKEEEEARRIREIQRTNLNWGRPRTQSSSSSSTKKSNASPAAPVNEKESTSKKTAQVPTPTPTPGPASPEVRRKHVNVNVHPVVEEVDINANKFQVPVSRVVHALETNLDSDIANANEEMGHLKSSVGGQSSVIPEQNKPVKDKVMLKPMQSNSLKLKDVQSKIDLHGLLLKEVAQEQKKVLVPFIKPVLNFPNLPVDTPTMDKRLQVPTKVKFVEKGYHHYHGRFTIKNMSRVHMTYRVYSTKAYRIDILPDMGILAPNEEVQFDVICNTKLFGGKIGVFGYPIYSKRQLNFEAINTLWSAYGTFVFSEKLAEEHSLSLVPATWSFFNDICIFENLGIINEEEQPLDWTVQNKIRNTMDKAKFDHYWKVDSEAVRKLQYDNEQMNWNRYLENSRAEAKIRRGTEDLKWCLKIMFFLFLAYVGLSYWGPEEWFEGDIFHNHNHNKKPMVPDDGWFKSWTG